MAYLPLGGVARDDGSSWRRDAPGSGGGGGGAAARPLRPGRARARALAPWQPPRAAAAPHSAGAARRARAAQTRGAVCPDPPARARAPARRAPAADAHTNSPRRSSRTSCSARGERSTGSAPRSRRSSASAPRRGAVRPVRLAHFAPGRLPRPAPHPRRAPDPRPPARRLPSTLARSPPSPTRSPAAGGGGGDGGGEDGSKQPRYWTPEEHRLFMEAVQRFGWKDVKSIAQHVGTRTPTQVRSEKCQPPSPRAGEGRWL